MEATHDRTQWAQAPVKALAGQFGQMGMGQKQFQRVYTTNLLTSLPHPRDLEPPPPEIQIPTTLVYRPRLLPTLIIAIADPRLMPSPRPHPC